MEDKKRTKVLILSVDANVKSGYGVISKQLIRTFKKLDIDISFVAYYGAKYVTYYEGIKILPSFDGKYGGQACLSEVKVNKPDYLLTTFDLFAIDPEFFNSVKSMGTKVISLLMVDASKYQSCNIPQLAEVDYPIIVTECANKELPTDYQAKTTYIPLQIDEDYKMIDKKSARIAFNKYMGDEIIDHDTKLVTVVSCNCGDSMGRKNFYGIILGWKKYLENTGCQNKRLYLHTDVMGIQMGGINIKNLMLANKYTAEQASTIIFPNQIKYLNSEITTEELNYAYSASDIYLNPAHGEGFGMPIIESIACGCAPLVTDFGAMRELIDKTQNDAGKHLMDGVPLYVGHSSIRCLVSPDTIAMELEYLFNNMPTLCERICASRRAIEEYGHDKQVILWRKFFEDNKEENKSCV
jgi:hypothetical protein